MTKEKTLPSPHPDPLTSAPATTVRKAMQNISIQDAMQIMGRTFLERDLTYLNLTLDQQKAFLTIVDNHQQAISYQEKQADPEQPISLWLACANREGTFPCALRLYAEVQDQDAVKAWVPEARHLLQCVLLGSVHLTNN